MVDLEELSKNIVLTVIVFQIFVMLAHILIFRFLNYFNNEGSRQLQFIKICFWGVAFVLFGQTWLSHNDPATIIASLVLCSMSAYFTFHIFNLSQTGRRLRLILHIFEFGTLPKEAAYGASHLVEARLLRLLQMRQIKQIGSGYHLRSRTFYTIGIILVTFKRIFFPKV